MSVKDNEELESRIRALESQVKYLMRCTWLLRGGKLADPSKPYYTWLIETGTDSTKQTRIEAFLFWVHNCLSNQKLQSPIRQEIKQLREEFELPDFQKQQATSFEAIAMAFNKISGVQDTGQYFLDMLFAMSKQGTLRKIADQILELHLSAAADMHAETEHP